MNAAANSSAVPVKGVRLLSKDKDSVEYDQVHYYLKASCLQLASHVIEKVEVWKVENLDLNYQYQQRTKNMMKLASWIDHKSLDATTNSLEMICERGFEFDGDNTKQGQGMTFSTGVLEQLSDKQFKERSEEEDQIFVYSEIAVGRSFIYDGESSGHENKNIPAGYDSLYISRHALDRNRDGVFSLQEYQAAANFEGRDASEYKHEYYVQDPLQVCPKYIVRFKIEPIRDDAAYAGKDILDHRYSYVDPISFTPVVKSSGMISGTRNNLISVEQAFNQAVEDNSFVDPFMENKEKWMERQLDTIDDKVREINLNYAEVSEAITKACDEAHRKLQQMTKDKLLLCLGMELEIKRQQEQLRWLDASLSKELQVISKALNNGQLSKDVESEMKLNYLRSWKCHTVFRNAWSRSKPMEFQSLSSNNGDIKVQADINIFSDPFNSQQGSSSNNGNEVDGGGSSGQGGNNNNNKQGSSRFFHKFVKASSSKGYFSSTAKPAESLMPLPLQNLFDNEVESIQQAIANALEVDLGFPLPPSIARPSIRGGTFDVPLHDLLRGLQEHSNAGTHPGTHESYLGSSSSAKNEFLSSLQRATADSMRDIVGTGGLNEEVLDFDRDEDENTVSVASRGNGYPSKGGNDHPLPMQSSTNKTESMPNSRQKQHIFAVPIPSSSKEKKKSSERERSHKSSRDKDTNNVISMTINQLQNAAANYFPQYSLDDIGSRKMRQMLVKRGLDADFKELGGFCLSTAAQLGQDFEDGLNSLLVSDIFESDDEALRLYFSLPFFSAPPKCTLLYSTYQHQRSLATLYSKTVKSRGPCIILIKTSERSKTMGKSVFGAYLSHPIVPTSTWCGSPSCFLFNLSVGAKLPYHARNAADVASEDPLGFYMQEDKMFFGYGDLSINEDLLTGNSEIENCYGMGLSAGSPEALCMMAGAPSFDIEDLEIWALKL